VIATQTMKYLIEWLDHSRLAGEDGRLPNLIHLAADPESATRLIEMGFLLYGRKKVNWSGQGSTGAVVEVRRKLKRATGESPAESVLFAGTFKSIRAAWSLSEDRHLTNL